MVFNEMVKIVGGKLTLGSKTELDNPTHEVILDDFYISKDKITREFYSDVMGKKILFNKVKPVSLTWNEAIIFCNKLSERENLSPYYVIDTNSPHKNFTSRSKDIKINVLCNTSSDGYRLPTEAEWEYTARGGQKGKNLHVHDWTTSLLLGVVNMHGQEWCWDFFVYGSDRDFYLDYFCKFKSGKNPQGGHKGELRVYRGGEFHDVVLDFYPEDCGIAFRYGYLPNEKDCNIRLARTIIPTVP